MEGLRLSSGQELLPALKAFVEEFTEKTLGDYTERLAMPAGAPKAAKEVNDPIWGTIKLSPLEVAVIDSPIVQRLRFVRQLGVVHWVYPGAGHSRFEHTLGVLHQSQQLITAINHSSGEPASNPPIDENRASLVRLCSLLHDVGHTAFSHVTEHALSKRTDLRLALREFANQNKVEKIQLSEIVAFYIVGSPSFEKMLAVALDQLGRPINYGGSAVEDAKRISGKIQQAIIGRMIDDAVPLLHEIITGPFDADKLDYYVRDARHAGVPSLVDISRLTQKIAVVKTQSEALPANIGANLAKRPDGHYLFGLKWSGAAILDELHLARVLLYAKIYRHKKVQAIEAMIDSVVEALGDCDNVDTCALVALAYEFSDDQILWSSGKHLAEFLGLDDQENAQVRFASEILARLRARNLFVCSLGVRSRYPSDPWGDDAKQSRGLTDLDADLSNPQKLRGFRTKLIKEVSGLFEKLPHRFGGLDIETVQMSVAISAKPQLGGSTEIDRAFILQGNRMLAGRDLDRINQPAWSSAYDFGTPSALIFCPRECSAAVYVAAEKVIRAEYQVVLPDSAMEMSKQAADEIEGVKREAEEAGWYEKAPLDIRALPERLTKADVGPRIEKIAAKLQTFDEPAIAIGQRRSSTISGRVRSWLAQFRDNDTIECALFALEGIKVLRRQDTQATLATFIKENPEFKGAVVCPFGTEKDSGAVQAYVSLDLPDIKKVMSIKEAAEKDEEGPIIFLDDFVGSGAQASTILGTWFEQSDLVSNTLGEERFAFSALEQDYLKKQRIGFVFVSGWEDGLKEIRDAIQKIGLNAEAYVHLMDGELPFAGEVLDDKVDGQVATDFLERCRHIGEELQKSAGKVGGDVTDRALGYGNRSMLLATSFNVPTQTLTCLWRDGQVDGVDWHALMRRRPKA